MVKLNLPNQLWVIALVHGETNIIFELDHTPFSNKSKRLFHIKFFFKDTMKKDIFNVNLVKWQIMISSHIKEELNSVDLDHERKSISINKVINLSIFLGRSNLTLSWSTLPLGTTST